MLKNLASMSSLNLARALVQFGIATLAAFSVLPGDYGLVSFSTPIIAFILLLTNMGLSSAIVCQPELDAAQAGGAFTFALTLGIAFAGALAALAFPLAAWTGLAGLGPVLVAFVAVLLCAIAADVPRALLERALRYQLLALFELGALGVATAVAVVALVAHAGIWAIVLYHLTLQAIRAGCFLVAARGGLAPNLRWRGIAPLLSFGGWVLGTNLVNFAARNADNLLIGTVLGAASLGLYGMAYQFMTLPLMALAWPASAVLMATLTRGGDPTGAAFAATVAAVSRITALVALPAMAWMSFALALPIDRLLAPRWHGLVPLLAILAPVGAIQALAAYNGAVLLARGRARTQFVVGLVAALVLVAGFVATLRFGLIVLAEVYALLATLVALGQIALMIRAAGLGLGAYLRSLLPALVATPLAYGAAALVGIAPAGWPGWWGMTGAYGAAVLLVYAAFGRELAASLRFLLRHGTRAAA